MHLDITINMNAQILPFMFIKFLSKIEEKEGKKLTLQSSASPVASNIGLRRRDFSPW